MNEIGIKTRDLIEHKIEIHEPFAKYLMADPEEYDFSISLLDVVRFSGHACPSVVGAFLIAKRAVEELFPQTNVCVRGTVSIQMSTEVEQGATGPISNVFSMIFGSWEKSGFGGLKENFVRRNLLQYGAKDVPEKTVRFKNLETGVVVDVFYDSSGFKTPSELENFPFQKIWRAKVKAILGESDKYISIKHIAESGSN